MKNKFYEKNQELKKYPGFLDFFSDSIEMLNLEDEDIIEENMKFNKDLGYNEIKKIPVFAALSKRPPTNVYTGGRTRPGGYNRNGKYLPAKYIPGKNDKRAGK